MRTPSEPRGRAVVPPLAPAAAAAALAPPRLPASAAEVVPLARRAAAAGVPVLVTAPAGADRLRLARALHALGARDGPLVAVTGRRPPLDRLPAGASLYVEPATLAPETALALDALADDGAVWVVAGVEPGAALPAPLAARLVTVVLAVPPLADRRQDVPALATGVLDALAARTGGHAARLSSGALARLVAHDWPGDVAELERTLVGAALRAGDAEIVTEHLGLGPAAAATPAAPAASSAFGAELEFVLAELAHELRNPMVTIKTYADHLPQLLEDADLRRRFAALTDDAITRIDDLLDNLLAFARLGPPHPAPIELPALLDRVVADVEPALGGRAVRVRHAGAGHCTVDPEHLAFALKNLFAGVAREVPPREELVADASVNGVVTLRFAAAGAALERLRKLAAPGETTTLADPTLQPLAFRLARSVLERNGGSLTVVADGEAATTLVVNLPTEHTGRG